MADIDWGSPARVPARMLRPGDAIFFWDRQDSGPWPCYLVVSVWRSDDGMVVLTALHSAISVLRLVPSAEVWRL